MVAFWKRLDGRAGRDESRPYGVKIHNCVSPLTHLSLLILTCPRARWFCSSSLSCCSISIFDKRCDEDARNGTLYLTDTFGVGVRICDEGVNNIQRRDEISRGAIEFCVIGENKHLLCALNHLAFKRNLL